METATKEKTVAKKTVNLRDISEGRKDILLIDPRKINVKKDFNVRKDMGEMKELTESIRENGVIVPMRIFTDNGEIFLSDGHRRFAAVNKLLDEGVSLKSVPCIPEDKGASVESLTARMLSYNDGKPLTPIEEAHLIMRLSDYGWSVEDIAKKTGRSQAHISNAKILVSLPKEVKKDIDNGIYSSTFALEMARESGDDHDKLKKTLDVAKEKAAALGKKKVTRNIAKKGTNKKTNRKAEKQALVETLKNAIKALQGDKEIDKADLIESLESIIAGLVGGATTAK